MLTNLLLCDYSIHQQPSAHWTPESMGKAGFISYHVELTADISVRYWVWLTAHWQLSSFYSQWDRCGEHVHVGQCGKSEKENANQDRSWVQHSFLMSLLTCCSKLWACSSPQAAIWKSREEWRYAGRGTSGLLWVCTDNKCDKWDIYIQLRPRYGPIIW